MALWQGKPIPSANWVKTGYDRGYCVRGGLSGKVASSTGCSGLALHLDSCHSNDKIVQHRYRIHPTERVYSGAFRNEQGDRGNAVSLSVNTYSY